MVICLIRVLLLLHGVPQRSTLGPLHACPLLYKIIFSNDLPSIVKHCILDIIVTQFTLL